jgi:2-polyprenyl-3-methyl-5-hydroxy-6-metoxy-1,4-benzoquinol methylase
METNIIKNTIENKLGIKTIEEYNAYKRRIWDEPVSMDEIENLSPDKIDSGEFWKYCDETDEFKFDTVAFGVSSNGGIKEANEKNFCIASELGIFSDILKYRNCMFNVLDIGAGFGMLKEELARYIPNAVYYGVDVHPKFEGCIKVTDCILPDEITEKKYAFVVACNVFQHLSIRQRRTYYEQIAKICNGYFVLTNQIDFMYESDTKKRMGFKCKDNDRRYMCHYGQFTEIQTMDEVMADLSKHFTILSVQRRIGDDYCCFHLFNHLKTV